MARIGISRTYDELSGIVGDQVTGRIGCALAEVILLLFPYPVHPEVSLLIFFSWFSQVVAGMLVLEH